MEGMAQDAGAYIRDDIKSIAKQTGCARKRGGPCHHQVRREALSSTPTKTPRPPVSGSTMRQAQELPGGGSSIRFRLCRLSIVAGDTTHVTMPMPGQETIGSRAVPAVGYNDNT